jgi:hypothetical protein
MTILQVSGHTGWDKNCFPFKHFQTPPQHQLYTSVVGLLFYVKCKSQHRWNIGRTLALGSIQSLTEMSTKGISWGVKAAVAWGWQPYHLHVPIVLKSGSLILLEPSGPVQACSWIDFYAVIIPCSVLWTCCDARANGRQASSQKLFDCYVWWTNWKIVRT